MSSRPGPVTARDKVSDVLARDESLVEVFIRHAPHFEKLRNRAMRRVMARLVTVEQAARTANIPAEQLVNDLNAALASSHGPSTGSSSGEVATRPASATPASGRDHPENAPVVELDVRDDLRSGREPFSQIMSAVASLKDGEVLRLRAIFEPAPLFAVLAKRGFVYESKSYASDDWSVWFWRPHGDVAAPGPAGPAGPASGAVDAVAADDEHTVHLDVRGLSPPEPMMQTLAALESLAPGRALVQINSRVPQFLLPMLAERGFTWEIDESQPERVLVRVSHAD